MEETLIHETSAGPHFYGIVASAEAKVTMHLLDLFLMGDIEALLQSIVEFFLTPINIAEDIEARVVLQ